MGACLCKEKPVPERQQGASTSAIGNEARNISEVAVSNHGNHSSSPQQAVPPVQTAQVVVPLAAQPQMLIVAPGGVRSSNPQLGHYHHNPPHRERHHSGSRHKVLSPDVDALVLETLKLIRTLVDK